MLERWLWDGSDVVGVEDEARNGKGILFNSIQFYLSFTSFLVLRVLTSFGAHSHSQVAAGERPEVSAAYCPALLRETIARSWHQKPKQRPDWSWIRQQLEQVPGGGGVVFFFFLSSFFRFGFFGFIWRGNLFFLFLLLTLRRFVCLRLRTGTKCLPSTMRISFILWS
jgi:hypothetical protein